MGVDKQKGIESPKLRLVVMDGRGKVFLIEPPSEIPEGYVLSMKKGNGGVIEKFAWGRTYTLTQELFVPPGTQGKKCVQIRTEKVEDPWDGDWRYVDYKDVTYEFEARYRNQNIEPRPPNSQKEAIQSWMNVQKRPRTVSFEEVEHGQNWSRMDTLTFTHLLQPKRVTRFTDDQYMRKWEILPDGSTVDVDVGTIATPASEQWDKIYGAEASNLLTETARGKIAEEIKQLMVDAGAEKGALALLDAIATNDDYISREGGRHYQGAGQMQSANRIVLMQKEMATQTTALAALGTPEQGAKWKKARWEMLKQRKKLAEDDEELKK